MKYRVMLVMLTYMVGVSAMQPAIKKRAHCSAGHLTVEEILKVFAKYVRVSASIALVDERKTNRLLEMEEASHVKKLTAECPTCSETPRDLLSAIYDRAGAYSCMSEAIDCLIFLCGLTNQ